MHDGQADGKTERCVEKRLISPSKRLEAALSAVKGKHFTIWLFKLQPQSVIKNLPTYLLPFSNCLQCKRKFDDYPIVNEKNSWKYR
jgi:hypothetical protein